MQYDHAGPAALASRPAHVVFIAVGSLRLPVIQRLVGEGRLPTFERLLGDGALAPHLANPYPNKSHTSWVSAATGATGGTHRVMSILRSKAGRPPFQQRPLGEVCEAEFLWEAAERQMRQVILLNFPDCWPSRLTRGIQVGGASLSVNATFHTGELDRYDGPAHRFALAADEYFATAPSEGMSPMVLMPAAHIGYHHREGVSRAACERLSDGAYEDLDQLLAAVVSDLPPETALMLMSQHGIVEPWDQRPGVGLASVLERAGLLTRTPGGAIDYGKSRAYPSVEGGLVYVQPWEAHSLDEVAEREGNLVAAEQALSAAVIESTGERAFPVVLRWEHAAPFGLHGPRQADLLVLSPAQHGGIHGACWPLTAPGESTLEGFYLLWGAGIRPGASDLRPVRPEDLAPTAAYLLGIDPPADSEGRILSGLLHTFAPPKRSGP